MDSPLPLVLVACSGPKLSHAAPAGELYTSPLFRKARARALDLGGDWRILSAAWGLLEPGRVIDPYDRRMPTTRAGRASWSRSVRNQLWQYRERRIVVLAGADYCAWINSEFANIERPLLGMGIGQQLHYLGQPHE